MAWIAIIIIIIRYNGSGCCSVTPRRGVASYPLPHPMVRALSRQNCAIYGAQDGSDLRNPIVTTTVSFHFQTSLLTIGLGRTLGVAAGYALGS
jgi:hypothetical protein